MYIYLWSSGVHVLEDLCSSYSIDTSPTVRYLDGDVIFSFEYPQADEGKIFKLFFFCNFAGGSHRILKMI